MPHEPVRTRFASPLIALAAAASVVNACSEQPAATREPVRQAAVESPPSHGDATPPEAVYERVIEGFAARGSAGAEAAWAERRPTLLLFSASW